MASQSRYIQQEYGTGSWNSPTNMTGGPDNNCGDLTGNGTYSEFDFTGTLFTIPGGSAIDGIEVIIDMSASDSDDNISIQFEDPGANWTDPPVACNNTAGTNCAASVAAPTIGGPTDDWSPVSAWTVAHLNSTSFRVRVIHSKSGKEGTIYCDSVQVIVYYTAGGASYFETPDEAITLADNQYKSATTLYDESTSVTEFLGKSMTNIFTEVSTLFSDVAAGLLAYLSRFEPTTLSDYTFNSIQTLKAESTALTDVMFKSLINLYTESTSIVDYLFSGIYQSIIDTVALSHYLNYLSNWERYPPEAITLATYTDTIWTAYYIITQPITIAHYLASTISQLLDILQTMNLLDYIDTVSTYTSSLLEEPILNDYLFKGIYSLLIESTTLNEYITYVSTSFLNVLETPDISDYIDALITRIVSVIETIVLPDYIAMAWTAIIVNVQPLNITDYTDITISLLLELLQTINLLDYFTTLSTYYYVISQSVTLSDILLSVWVTYEYIINTLDINEYFNTTKSVLLGLLQSTILLDYITRSSSWYYVVPQSATLLDSLRPLWTAYRSIPDTLDITHYLDYALIASQILVEAASIMDYITYDSVTTRYIIDALAFVDTITFTVTKLYTNALTLVDVLDYTPIWKRVMLEVPSINDFMDITLTLTRIFTEPISLLDFFDYSTGALLQAFIEAINVSHYVEFGIRQRLYETVSVVDSVAREFVEFVARFIRLRFIGD